MNADFIYEVNLSPLKVFSGDMILSNNDENFYELELDNLSELGKKFYKDILPHFDNEYEALDYILEIVKESWDSMGTTYTMNFTEKSGFEAYYKQEGSNRNVAVFDTPKLNIHRIMTTKDFVSETYSIDLIDESYLKSFKK